MKRVLELLVGITVRDSVGAGVNVQNTCWVIRLEQLTLCPNLSTQSKAEGSTRIQPTRKKAYTVLGRQVCGKSWHPVHTDLGGSI